jgi:hypothetical protein
MRVLVEVAIQRKEDEEEVRLLEDPILEDPILEDLIGRDQPNFQSRLSRACLPRSFVPS